MSDRPRKLKKKHHIQSEFYLRRFAIPSKDPDEPDGFWVYRRGQGTPPWLPPESTAIRSHFYSYRDDTGQRNDDVENLLCEIETIAAPAMVQITSPGGFPPSPSVKSRITFYMALAAVRTPSMRARAINVFERWKISQLKALSEDPSGLAQSVEQFNREKGRNLHSEEAHQFIDTILSGETSVKLTNRAQVIAPLALAIPMCGLLLDLHWSLLIAPAGQEFVTGDDPLVIATKDGQETFAGRPEIKFTLDNDRCRPLTSEAP